MKILDKFNLNYLMSFLPSTLMGRSALIIIVPLILVQIISTFIFYDNHWDTLSKRLAQGLAGDISHIRIFIQDYNTKEEFNWIKKNVKETMSLKINLIEDRTLSNRKLYDENSNFPDILTRELWRELERPFTINFEYSPREIEINLQLNNDVLNVLAPRSRLFSSTTYIFVLWMIGSSLLLFGIAVLFLNAQVRSVRRLARAADNFGKGRDVPNFKPEGALEVRQAAKAFNIMRDRIKKQINQRTEMLAGVSHDLRTPLSRLKLHLEMLRGVDNKEIDDLKEDIDEMQGMLDAYLSFARGESEEKLEEVNIHDLLNDMHEKFSSDNINFEIFIENINKPIAIKKIALKRCLNNLILNAGKYSDQLIVNVRLNGRNLEINIDDDGPGIPEEERDNVFKPFYRLDPSRNLNTGGVGLGLTIARDIARSLGGDVILNNGKLGGLRATIRLPI